MREVKSDLSNLDKVISKQYEDIIRGLAKDSMQNSWEARINRKRGTDFKLAYEFFDNLDGHKNVLMFEDNGTVGMDDRRWKAFHSHWVTTKGDYKGGIGRWGQGKTLYLYFSSRNRIVTESIDAKKGTYRYSVRTNVGYWQENKDIDKKDPNWVKNNNGDLKRISDFFPSFSKLNHPGTRIWILDVKEEFVEDIVNWYFAQQLSESWWELIRNFDTEISVNVNRNGRKESKSITLPMFPAVKDKIIKEHLTIDKSKGKIRKLKIVLCDDMLPQSLGGIAIQRGRMTVCRHDLPSSIPDDIRSRVYGYCLLDDILDEAMWKIEMPNHEGFTSRNAIWVALRSKIDSISQEFLLKYSKSKEIKMPQIKLDELIKTVNKLVDEHLHGLGRGGKKGDGGGQPKPLPRIHISPWGYQGNSRRFDKGDFMKIKGGIKNTTVQGEIISLRCSIEDSNNVEYWSYNIKKQRIEANTKKTIDIPEIEIDNLSLLKGRYALKASLECKELDIRHERSAVFYFEQEPPLLGGWLKKLLMDRLGGTKINLRNLPINDKGVLFINTAYPEIEILWKSNSLTKRQKISQLGPIIINICLHEATRAVSIKWWTDENTDFNISEIKRSKDLFDEMWAAYLTGK